MRTLLQNSIRLVPWPVRKAIKHLPLAARLQRRLLAKYVEGREFVHTVDAGPAKGLVYPVILPDDKGVWTGTYEVDFVSRLAEAVNVGDVCYDVGGWRGYCSGAMARQGARLVVAFEPLPENCRRIERMAALNPALPIRLVEAAVGKTDGVAKFNCMAATSMGKLAESGFQADAEPQQTFDVEVTSLDAWRKRNEAPFPQVVKIDVEGAEMIVLEGAAEILEKSQPTLFIEAHSRELEQQVRAFVSKFGYATTILEDQARAHAPRHEVCHVVATIVRS